ncbi:hypothetical protein [Streptomyces sp. NPDC088748]|uniref:hypothetical protein n=1 Tax=Streptomyces sp. NPDC088748 TaxID=3365887 RepID=UPI00380F7F25
MFDGVSESGVGPVEGLLAGGEVLVWMPSAGIRERSTGPDVAEVGEDGCPEVDARADDAVPASGGEIEFPAGQCSLDPQDPTCGVGDGLQVHAVPAVFPE